MVPLQGPFQKHYCKQKIVLKGENERKRKATAILEGVQKIHQNVHRGVLQEVPDHQVHQVILINQFVF